MHRRAAALSAVLVSSLLSLCCGGSAQGMRPIFPEHAAPAEPKRPVLFVLSAASEQVLADGSRRKTGTFMGELYEPYLAVQRAGHEIVVATVAGARPAIDPESWQEKYWDDLEQRERARAFARDSLSSPISLEAALAGVDGYQGVVVPGGQGVMVDLLESAELHGILRHAIERDKPLGLICHAPAVLTRLPAPGGNVRRSVTSVSWFEEHYIETFVMGENAKERMIGQRLEAHGYDHEAAFPGSAHAVRDCNLVTSQNPFSTARFSDLYLQALADYRRGARCRVASP